MSFVVGQLKTIDSRLEQLEVESIRSIAGDEVDAAEVLGRGFDGTGDGRSLAHDIQCNTLPRSDVVTDALQPISAIYETNVIPGSNAGLLPIELEWILVAKATSLSYGIVLDSFIQQTIRLNYAQAYWSEVLDSYRYTSLYSVQTAPWRLFEWSRSVWHTASTRKGFNESWAQFYGIVSDVVKERSLQDVQKRVTSRVAVVRTEVKVKQDRLSRAWKMHATGIGHLLENGFKESTFATTAGWKKNIADAITVAQRVIDAAAQFDDLTDAASLGIEDLSTEEHNATPSDLVAALQSLLQTRLTAYHKTNRDLLAAHGRPSRLVRYWLPATLLLLSSSTLLRIAVRRKAAITQWIRDLGRTTIDFWLNWVVQPVQNIIKTIRHDQSSEISIISKRSLEGDRASLERMVVDFATSTPGGAPPRPGAARSDTRWHPRGRPYARAAGVREGAAQPAI